MILFPSAKHCRHLHFPLQIMKLQTVCILFNKTDQRPGTVLNTRHTFPQNDPLRKLSHKKVNNLSKIDPDMGELGFNPRCCVLSQGPLQPLATEVTYLSTWESKQQSLWSAGWSPRQREYFPSTVPLRFTSSCYGLTSFHSEITAVAVFGLVPGTQQFILRKS